MKFQVEILDHCPDYPCEDPYATLDTPLWYDSDEDIPSPFQQLTTSVCRRVFEKKGTLTDDEIGILRNIKYQVDKHNVDSGVQDKYLVSIPIGCDKTSMIGLMPYILEAEFVLIASSSKSTISKLEVDLGMTKDHTLVQRDLIDEETFFPN